MQDKRRGTLLPLDIRKILEQYKGRNHDLHREHINPQFASVLKTIGFDRTYVKAQGAHLWDSEGNKYLDMQGGYAVHNTGRNHPAIRQALIDFLQEDYPSLLAFEAPLLSGILAGELKKRMPNQLDYVFFTNSGTEGVEAALKFARCATGKPAILYANKSFHGLSYGSLSVNGDEYFRKGFGPFVPNCVAIPFNDLTALEHALSSNDVAGFIIEPIQGKGVHVPSSGYLRHASELCHKHGALFIVDEVQTGFGRTGRFLAIEHEGDVDPDIVIVAKALSGGYVPVGAVLTKKHVWKKVFSSMDRAVVHSSTFHQGSLAMVAGLASLQAIDDDHLVENAAVMGQKLIDGLRAMQSRFEFIKDVRGRGLMIGIEFGKPKSLSLRTAWSLIHSLDSSLFPQAISIPLMEDHHVLTQTAGHGIDVVKLIPPLVINDEDVTWFLDAFEDVMNKLHKFPGPTWDLLKRLGKHAVSSGKSKEPALTVT